ncbi:unnamed protein product [Laminaria digitata]
MGWAVVGVLGELVTNEDKEQFTRNGGELLKTVLADSSIWFRQLVQSKALGADTALLSSVNEKALTKTLGNSNKSNVTLGPGLQPQLSTDATTVLFDPDVMREWLDHEDSPAKKGDDSRGKRARAFAVEYSAMVVERRVPNSTYFGKLWQSDGPQWLTQEGLDQEPASAVHRWGQLLRRRPPRTNQPKREKSERPFRW